MPTLRMRQEECLDAIDTRYTSGTRQQLVVMATGTGKSVVIANIPRKMRHALPGKMLVFPHTEELVKQLVETMQEWNPELKVGREQAEHYADTDCDIVVACVASIGREGATRLQRFGEFDIVVCDEAHHSIAQSYINVFNSTGVLQENTRKLLVGFTATPKRKNRVGKRTADENEELLSLKSVYKEIVFTYTIRKAIKEGWLVPLRGFRLKTETDLSEIKSTAGDYNQEALADTVNTSGRNREIVKAWKDYADNRETVAFTVDIQHAKDLAEEFCAAGILAAAVWGTDPDRTKKIEGFKRGDLKVLCNCGVLTEGFDAWNILCIILARPTKSSTLFTQMVGRGTRLEAGTGNLLEAVSKGVTLRKKDAYVIDVVDNNKKCSLVTFPTLVGLAPDFNLHGESITTAIDKVEEMQEKNPGIDFSHLTDLSAVKAYVEALDLFSEPFTQEVKEYSQLKWLKTQDDAFILAIPEDKAISESKEYWRFKHEKLRITEDELEKFVLTHTTVDSDRELRVFNTLREAFEAADKVVRDCRSDRVKLIERTARWHNDPASDAAKNYLLRLTKKRPFPRCLCASGPGAAQCRLCPVCNKQQGLTAGQAALAIDKLKIK